MLSGPAGGVAAAARCAATLGIERIVTLDMGGTSTDVALVEGRLPRRPDSRIAGLPILTPCIDIHTVGAGGGSIAHLDAGGALKVGPESAGAEPGPACYGKSDEPTVTDANVVLGRLRPELFLGGHMVLDPSRSRRAIARLTRSLGARTVEEAAEGIVRVVEGTMERAIRVITIERGQDPRSCALVAFGGAAGLHACGLADALEIDTVVVPADPGLLSAWGVLAGEVVRDRRRALRLFDPGARALVKESRPLVRAATRDVVGEGLRAADVRAQVWVAVRYRGQSLELEVPLGDDFRRSFDRAHAERFHTCDTARSIEVTGIRATATGHTRTRLRKLPRSRVRSQPSTPVKVWVGGRFAIARLHARESLGARARVFGPAVITEYSSTTFVAPGWRASAQAGGELVVRRVAARRKRLG
jgi:N-methylhydantoinase A